MPVPEPTSGKIQTFVAKFLFIYELHATCYPQAAYKASSVLGTLPQKDQTLPFPTQMEGMSLSAALLPMFRSARVNQKAAKFICLIF